MHVSPFIVTVYPTVYPAVYPSPERPSRTGLRLIEKPIDDFARKCASH
jgi:hypothetical protein